MLVLTVGSLQLLVEFGKIIFNINKNCSNKYKYKILYLYHVIIFC